MVKNGEERLIAQIVKLTATYGRCGWRRITALLKQKGWKIDHKTVSVFGEGRVQGTEKSSRSRDASNQGWFLHEAQDLERKNHGECFDLMM